MAHHSIIFTNAVGNALDTIITDLRPSGVWILADTNTAQHVVPSLRKQSRQLADAPLITIPAGDEAKNIESLSMVWTALSNGHATRKSVLINVGGGMITDLGGFAAATFKRGMRFVNVPTTLLGAVDAAIGGKTGINFNGLKNEIGVFREADAVVLSACFFPSLPHSELLSGYAEMLKHGLISDIEMYGRILDNNVTVTDSEELLCLLRDNVTVKQRIVAEDPHERGIRRALNLGHTAGHAFESLALKRGKPIPHGYAVAWGLVVELILSHLKLKFSSTELHRVADYVYANYGVPAIMCSHYNQLLELVTHHKTNDRNG
ncbi:MAG: 3-dehydroquinate synthase, partial [Muribaculaceae bacterium]|nr:3-dehydroquinate synthase [Muribaculaceae bacterium]